MPQPLLVVANTGSRSLRTGIESAGTITSTKFVKRTWVNRQWSVIGCQKKLLVFSDGCMTPKPNVPIASKISLIAMQFVSMSSSGSQT